MSLAFTIILSGEHFAKRVGDDPFQLQKAVERMSLRDSIIEEFHRTFCDCPRSFVNKIGYRRVHGLAPIGDRCDQKSTYV